MGQNKLIIAAAGSGKTTFLVNKAIGKKDGHILITTYTRANEEEIRSRFYRINKCIPDNVTIHPWFSFLLQHGARPYQGCKTKEKINGLILYNGQSAKGVAEVNTEKHYFTETHKIYSDKLSKFVFNCNKENNGEVINRLSRIYTDIFIDEVQDLSGYDLELLKLLFDSSINVLLVGDPRQGTYSTSNSAKNKQYKKSKIIYFFEDTSLQIEKDNNLLTTNYRSCPAICDLSNNLFPALPKTHSGNNQVVDHSGVFLVKRKDIGEYLKRYEPIQLRDSSRNSAIRDDYSVINFGKSKGLEFERVLIYPTQPFIDWLEDNNSDLAPTSRSKFYVAITRAKYSVGIVYDYDDSTNVSGAMKFVPSN